MPMYEYECPRCKSTIDIQQRIVEEPLKDFPCHLCWVDDIKQPMRRVIAKTSFTLNGSGWYAKGGY